MHSRACGIATDGTRVDFPPKSNPKIENALDTEHASVLLVESDEKAAMDVSAVVSVESNNTNTLLSRNH